MANDTTIHIVGNLTADPELRFTPSGAAVVNLTVASTPSFFDKNANEWKDKQALFLRCNAWRDFAENITESLKKGDRVVIVGNLVQRVWETQEGDKRYVVELEIVDIGASAKYATLKVNKKQRPETSNGTPPPEGYRGRGSSSSSRSAAKNDDPWGDVPPPNSPDDEPPF